MFFWVGTCSYPETSLILIWSAEFENEGSKTSRAAPWDTGGMLSRTFGRTLGVDEAKNMLDRYSLGIDDYRVYVSTVIEVCFSSPWDYVAGHPPHGWYPGWVHEMPRGCGSPSHTFELRRQGAVTIANHLVALVVDPRAFVNHSSVFRRLRAFAKERNIDMVQPRYEASVQEEALAYVERFMHERGVVQ